MKTKVTVALMLIVNLSIVSAQETKKPKHFEVFEPFKGTWFAPDSVIAKNPQMQGKGIFNFEIDKQGLCVKVLEGFSLVNKDDREFEALVVKNALSGHFEFIGTSSRMFFFQGQYKDISAKGFTREYTVSYPMESEMAKNFGQVLSFREVFRVRNPNVMAFDIEYYNKKSMKWEPWSDREFVIVRR